MRVVNKELNYDMPAHVSIWGWALPKSDGRRQIGSEKLSWIRRLGTDEARGSAIGATAGAKGPTVREGPRGTANRAGTESQRPGTGESAADGPSRAWQAAVGVPGAARPVMLPCDP